MVLCRRFLSAAMLVVAGIILSAQGQQLQDGVYLKNGSIIRGMIIEQVPGKSLKVQTQDGSVFVYTMEEIERITKEAPMTASTQPASSMFSVGGHVATDISGGLGFGGGLAYILAPGASSFAYEFGLDYYFHEYDETEGGNTEYIDLSVFAVRANWLWSFTPRQSHVYFVTGVGFVVASLDWKNVYDPAVYGYSLTEDETFTSVGNVINLGVGWTSQMGLGVRLETPMLFFYDSGRSSAFVPTFGLAIKYFF